MYIPVKFRQQRSDVLHALIREYPFGTLVTSIDTGLSADHIPFVLHADVADNGALRGHIARSNPLRTADRVNREILVIFQGPQSYITPSWYPSKQEHGKVVPTWNYAVAHVYGNLQIHDSAQWLQTHLKTLTTQQEISHTAPWRVEDAPVEFIRLQMKGIVGLEIEITRIEGKWKLSQNKNEADRQGVVAGLKSLTGEDDGKLSNLMDSVS